MDPTSVLSIDPPDHLSDEQKELYSACSPRMKVALAIASDFKDEDEYWKVFKGFKDMGCTDLVSLGSRNMGVTPTKIVAHFDEMFEDDGLMEYDMSLGKASRIKEIANSAMKAQDKSDDAFHKFLSTHGIKTLSIDSLTFKNNLMDLKKLASNGRGGPSLEKKIHNMEKIQKQITFLPMSCPQWHTQKREKSLKRKREEAKEKEESNGDE